MIRTATTADIPRMVDLGRLMHEESPVYRRLTFSADRLAQSLAVAIRDGFARVVEKDGQIIGGMAAIAMQHWCSEDMVSSDLALFIAPECRGGMAAARLITAYTAWAADLGIKLPMLGVTAGIDTEITVALCERLGWRRFGVLMEMT